MELHSHNPKWKEIFLEEKETLNKFIGNKIIDIQHVGSTSISGLEAKPIIDMVVGIKDFEESFDLIHILEGIGYKFKGDAGVPGRWFFTKGNKNKNSFHLQVCEIESEVWNSLVLFRDYLNEHPEKRKEYETLKEKLKEKYSNDRKAYSLGKNDFIKSVIELAETVRI